MPKRPAPAKKRPTPPKKSRSYKSTTAKKPNVAAVAPEPDRSIIAPPKGLKRLNYQTWRRNRKTYINRRQKLPGIWSLTKKTATLLWANKILFGGVLLIYGILNLILVQGIASNSDVSTLRSGVTKSIAGNAHAVGTSFKNFVTLAATSNGGQTGATGSYQLVLILLASLALIWCFRQSLNGVSVRIRDAYYKGVYPLVPFIIILFVIGLELLPLILGAALYSLAVSGGIAVSAGERDFWLLFFIGTVILSLFWLASSIFALYIVTLPDMTPMAALRSARELVRYRRWTIMLRLVYLPIALVIIGAVIIIPVIVLVAPLTRWVFFLLTIVAVAAVNGYFYTLYRELLND